MTRHYHVSRTSAVSADSADTPALASLIQVLRDRDWLQSAMKFQLSSHGKWMDLRVGHAMAAVERIELLHGFARDGK